MAAGDAEIVKTAFEAILPQQGGSKITTMFFEITVVPAGFLPTG
ncbi:hypothetical protein [Methylobacterium sp. J-077]|nr:hypothetical protein [Methylobacterium sp. J-077]